MMKRWMGAVAAFALVASIAGAADAAAVGPIRPEMGHWTVGGELGFEFDRDWENAGTRADKWETDERFQYVGRLAYGLTEDWEIYGRLGASSFEVEDVADAGGGLTNSIWDLGTQFAWGVGGKGFLWHDVFPGWDIGLDAQYFAHSGHDGNITSGANVGSAAQSWDYWEWSLALLFQTEYESLTPYLGPVFGDANVERSGVTGAAAGRPTPTADLDADDNVGVLVGTGFDFAEGWSGYVEGRFVDATAVNVGLLWTF